MGINDRRQEAKEAKREAGSAGKSGVAEWRGYINVDLSPDEKAQFDEWMRGDDPWDILTEIAAAGCVVTVKTNAGSTGFMASITQRSPASVNAGLCVTARASSAGKALFRAVFLVASLGVAEDWTKGHEVADPDRW